MHAYYSKSVGAGLGIYREIVLFICGEPCSHGGETMSNNTWFEGFTGRVNDDVGFNVWFTGPPLNTGFGRHQVHHAAVCVFLPAFETCLAYSHLAFVYL